MTAVADTPARPSAAPAPFACNVSLIELDFEGRREGPIRLEDAVTSMALGRFVWIDVDAGDVADARRIVTGLKLVSDDVVDLALRDEPSTQYGRHDGYVHLVVSGYRQRGQDFDLERVSVTLGERFLLTIHRGPVRLPRGRAPRLPQRLRPLRQEPRASCSTRSGTT